MSIEIENADSDAFLNVSHSDRPGYVTIEAVMVHDFAGEELMAVEQLGQFRIRDLLIALHALGGE